MIQKLPESNGIAFGFKVTGKLTGEDIDHITPLLDAAIAQHKKPMGLLIDIAEMHGATWEARFAEMGFLRHHADHIARVAIVCNDQWQELSERVVLAAGGLLAETLYFLASEIDHAWHWVRFTRADQIAPVRRILPGTGLFANYTPEYLDV